MKQYRNLTESEIKQLSAQACYAEDWTKVFVSEGFSADKVFSTRFSGVVRMGRFDKDFGFAGGMTKHAGLYHTTLHNVEIGDDCCIENVKNYIANYRIGEGTLIENVDIIVNDGLSSFGNGVEVAVMSETGGRKVMIYDALTAQMAYFMALYRHRIAAVDRFRKIITDYAAERKAEMAEIGRCCRIVDTGYIKDVRIGDFTRVEGASRLFNGTICSSEEAPARVGVGVIADDFIIGTGSTVKDGVMLTRCFVGQACHLGHGYSASDSLFFANCQGENGEACSIFAGPFTVTHHKSSLLIAGMFSFMNAGSGSNQSNHMYKLGPIHQGIMERGAKTASDSYILWPARIGAFSLVMGRHSSHQDTSDMPFSYLIEQQSTTYIMPGANLKSVGTIRDAKKWPKRDERKGPKLDIINFNLLSPYTAQKMLNAISQLRELKRVSGENTQEYSYQNGKIRRSSLEKGLKLYGIALDKFLGNSLISRMQKSGAETLDELRRALLPTSPVGEGKWLDIAGLLAPKSEISLLLDEIGDGILTTVEAVSGRLQQMQENYYDYEWTWAYEAFKSYYGIDLGEASRETLVGLVSRWRESVISLDNMLLEDARKEFSLCAMTSFGADGGREQQVEDFLQVRGAFFEKDPFVVSIKEHISSKTRLGDYAVEMLDSLR